MFFIAAEFFKSAPKQPLFVGDYVTDRRTAEGCMRHLRAVFEALEDCRVFEVIKNGPERANFLLTRQVRFFPLVFLSV